MYQPDHYKTILKPSERILKIKGSVFHAFAVPIGSEKELPQYIKTVKEKAPGASHYCYAMVMHPGHELQKSSDAGEPANTAGKPILRAILSAGLTNIAIIIARHFGGTKLGVPGLIQAYHESAATAISNAEIIEVKIRETYSLRCDLSTENDAYRFIKMLGAEVFLAERINERLRILFVIELGQKPKLLVMKEQFYFLEIEKEA
jgi:putative IMPACT (imprinted ancient) family translation regulator